MSGIIGTVWLEHEGWTYPYALLEFRHGREAVGADLTPISGYLSFQSMKALALSFSFLEKVGLCFGVNNEGFTLTKQHTCTNRSIRVDQLLKTLSETLGLPWRSVEEFDSAALIDAVERAVVKPDGVDVVMKYRQVANG